MKHIALSLTAATLTLCLGLSACSKSEAPAPAAPATAPTTEATPAAASASTYDTVASQVKGFTVGPLMSANTVYVLFDPQCPHCGHLWQASLPLQKKVKFVWAPVSFINGKSAPQGAAILSAADPAQFMSAHEASILAGTGGAPLPASVAPEHEAIIKSNTALFNSLQVASVPYMVAKNARTNQVVSNAGAMDTAALAEFLGVTP